MKNAVSARKRILFILLNICVVAYIAWREFHGGERAVFTGGVHAGYLGAAVLCFGVMLGAETWKYAWLLRRSGHATPWRTGFGCAVLGKYYDNITPAGCGGQPFQIHYLSKHGCSDGVSGALPILGFLGLQLSFVLMALVVLVSGAARDELPALRAAACGGLCLYAALPLCILLFAAIPKPLEAIVRWGTSLLQRLHILKDGTAAADRTCAALASYTESLTLFGRSSGVFAVVALLSLVFRAAMVCMPWFVLRAFGAAAEPLHCVCQVICLYAAVAVIPTPGNSGAAEASFYAVFSAAGGGVFAAMLVWRGLCYYSWLLAGVLFYGAGLARR